MEGWRDEGMEGWRDRASLARSCIGVCVRAWACDARGALQGFVAFGICEDTGLRSSASPSSAIAADVDVLGSVAATAAAVGVAKAGAVTAGSLQ